MIFSDGHAFGAVVTGASEVLIFKTDVTKC
jgi:hypothetical protein